MKIIKSLPVPVCGLALGIISLGNLIQSFSSVLRYICGGIGAFILVLFIIRCIINRKQTVIDMNDPVAASVSGTATMALILLAGYLEPFSESVAIILWYLGIILHGALIVYFTVVFVRRLKIKQIFASWYIVYVGIAVAAITAPQFHAEKIGLYLLCFGAVTFLILFAIITKRYIQEEIPMPAKPLICIYAAPISLLLTGYIQTARPDSIVLLVTVWIIASLFYIFALIKMVGLIMKEFYPSWAAFTFPFVISAIASKQCMSCAALIGMPQLWMMPFVIAETGIAVILVVYVFLRYICFLLQKRAS